MNNKLLYRVWNGKLETVTFVKKQIHDGATVETYTVKYPNGRKTSCSTDYFHPSEKIAWQEYAKELKMYGPQLKLDIEKAQKQLENWKNQTEKTNEKIEQFSS